MSPDTQPATEPFEIRGHYGERDSGFRSPDLAFEVGRLIDPGSAYETLHWGRNYLYAVRSPSGDETLDLVVKQFRNQGLRARLERRWKGSKATRSWRGAWALTTAAIPTARPVLLIESNESEGPSHFVTERLEGVFEARYYFRALNEGREKEAFPEVSAEAFLVSVATLLRRLHDAGIWHRDVSVGNLLVEPAARPDEPPVVYLVDLNRAKVDCRLTVGRRTRDLSRLRIFLPAQRDLLLETYWEGRTAGMAWKRFLYMFQFRSFLFKRGLKDGLRKPFKGLKNLVGPRHAHVHIPEAPTGTSTRDRVVWDRLSDQPHQHAGRLGRIGVRVRDGGHHMALAGRVVTALPRINRRYRELRRELYAKPVPWGAVGLALRPWPADPEALLAAVDRSGLRHVLLRLHPWEEAHEAEATLARELHARGIDLTFALPQNRGLVRDPGRWAAAVERLGEAFLPFGRSFQVGQAINRSKWGVWNHREYQALAVSAGSILRNLGDVEILGPAVIDWEPHATAGILNGDWGGFRFDVVTSLLYVDRRGAPENSQLGFDSVDKIVQLSAIGETSRAGSARHWITEVNWPLREGPHSPAGRSVAVDEETQADYLVRFYLLALGTGLVERVYWWQLMARGYGLAWEDQGRLVLRPSFRALATLERQLAGGRFVGPMATEMPVRIHHFETSQGDDLMVGWSTGEVTRATLPRRAVEVVDRDGKTLAAPAGPEVELHGSPIYFRLEAP